MTIIRKFGVPYNGSNPKEYIRKLKPYHKYIDHVFLGLPYHRSHLTDIINDCRNNYELNCHEFLLQSAGGDLKRVVTLNTNYDMLYQNELEETADKISHELFFYGVNDVIVSSFALAKRLRENIRDLNINTSCNCFQYDIREMKMWDKQIGIDYFNPPRSTARNIKLLKKMHDAGFKLKVLVNEGCLVGCPQEVSHFVSCGNNIGQYHDCLREDAANIFKCCWVLPRWLCKLDKYVDVYKISGRFFETDHIIRLLDAYAHNKECSFSDIYDNYKNYGFKAKHPINTKDIPDKLASCMCMDCNTCKICDNLAEKFFTK